jgi:thioredoxin-related protein
MKQSRLKASLRLLLCLLVWSVNSRAAEDEVPSVEDFQQLAQEAQARRLPILLMVSQYHCGFCERMKEEVLGPMVLSGDYTSRVLIRQLQIDPGQNVTDFQGRRLSAEAFIARYKIRVTPTLLFLDAKGNEATKRIVGINTVDFLIFYIEEAIDEAIKISQ